MSGRARDIALLRNVGPSLGPTKPPVKWATAVLSPGLKHPARESDQAAVSGAYIKIALSCANTFTFPYEFMACTATNLPLKFILSKTYYLFISLRGRQRQRVRRESR